MARTNARTRWLCEDCGYISSERRITEHAAESDHQHQVAIKQGPSAEARKRAAYTNAVHCRDKAERYAERDSEPTVGREETVDLYRCDDCGFTGAIDEVGAHQARDFHVYRSRVGAS